MLSAFLLAFFVLLHAWSNRRDRPLDAIAEATMLFVIGYSILGALVGTLGLYDHRLCTLLLLTWALVKALRSDSHRIKLPRYLRLDLETLGLLAVLATFLALAEDRFEYIEMTRDPAVYCNLAKNLVQTGGNEWTLEVQEELAAKDPELANRVFLMAGLPGLYSKPDEEARVYQFLLGWPSVLALGIALFGPFEYSAILLLLGVLSIFWFHRILAQWLFGWKLFLATAVFALNPLFVYFSKYTASEAFLLCVVLYLLAIHVRGSAPIGNVVLAVLALGATHISLFIYLPLLAMYFVWASVADRRDDLRKATIISLIFTVCLGLAYLQSPPYFADIFLYNFGRFAEAPFWVFATLVGGLALSLAGLAFFASVRSPFQNRRIEGPFLRGTGLALRISVVLLLLQAARSAYLLGWTSHYVENRELHGVWMGRVEYAGQGLVSLLHHNVVSIALGTGVTLFIVVLVAVLWWRRRAVEDRTDLFLLTGWVWTLAVYVLLRPDTPVNYYASRYFLPVLVPFGLLYSLKYLSRVRGRLFLALTLPALLFNLVYTGFQAAVPTFQGRHDLIRQLDERLPNDALVVFMGPPSWVHEFAANVITYDLGGRYARVEEYSQGALRDLRGLVRILKPSKLYLLSDGRLDLEGVASVITEIAGEDQVYVYPYNILYPLSARKVKLRFFLHELDDATSLVLSSDRVLEADELAYLSPESFEVSRGDVWSSGSLDVTLPRPWTASRLRIQSGGLFISHVGASELEVEVNGEIFISIVLDEKVEIIELGEPISIRRFRIHSSTFVPKELGLNEDTRTLGLDIASVAFE